MTETTIFEPCQKANMFSDEVKALILFNATMIAVSSIKDSGYRQSAKMHLNKWFAEGVKFWKEIKRNANPEAIDTYEELAIYVKEVSYEALQKDDYDKFLEEIKAL